MTALVGRSLVLLSLSAATAGAMAAFATGARPGAAGWAWTRRLAYLYAGLITAANLVMIYALLARDFSVSYVAQVGSRSVPDWVAVVSLWSSLEGSILFWAAVLGLHVAAATFGHRNGDPAVLSWAVGTWLACAAFFSFLVSGPAQPFQTVGVPPADGPGPNPLLQNHVLMAFHPPFLYGGYVGMTIPFGLVAAALLSKRLGGDVMRSLRTWLLLPWIFQTVAIVLGGWWAYEVLGWGGYWSWDPVENASLLPWLTATAALHSALLTEHRAVLKGWTVALVQVTFLLTILGTFMTRSGVFNSVHSFTQSAIGPALLAFLAAGLVFSVVLLARGVDALASEGQIQDVRSRDAAFLAGNLVLALLTFTVLVGTVFPLVVEAWRGVQMSVGRPYFDKMTAPLGVALLFLMGVGPAMPWGRATAAEARRALLPPLAGAAVLAALGYFLGVRQAWPLLTLALGGYAGQVTVRAALGPVRKRMRTNGESLRTAALEALVRRGRRRFAGYVVHAGTVVVIISIAVSSSMSRSSEVQLARGGSATIGDYTVTFLGTEAREESHRQAMLAHLAVRRSGEELGTLTPRLNRYEASRDPIGTPAVRTSVAEDLYVSILDVSEDGERVALQVFVNPMVAWIWVAAGVMALGGVIGLWPQRAHQAARAGGRS